MKIAFVALGGASGAVLRYAINLIGKDWHFAQIPLATTFVNCLGCLLMGIFSVLLITQEQTNYRLLLITGFCGGFTTFSAFAMEQKQLLDNKLLGQQILHLALNNILGIIFVLIGYYITQKLWIHE